MTRWSDSDQVDQATVNNEFKDNKKLRDDTSFEKKVRIFQKYLRRNANVFSIFLGNLDWDQGAKNSLAVFDLANGFFTLIDQ